jgi:ferredoxin-NADP reductase
VGGDFLVHQLQHDITPFIAGGVGITPLLGQVHLLTLAPDRFRLLWVIRSTDAGLVRDTFLRFPELGKCAVVFFTGEEEDDDDPMVMEGVERLGAKCVRRRLGKGDVDEIRAETWYLCAGKGLRKQVLAWLGGKKVVFEDFDY